MLKKKVGVLSTRSPHRPNPIGEKPNAFVIYLLNELWYNVSGITLACIERVDKKNRCLHVTACDLVHNTPILDIKVDGVLL